MGYKTALSTKGSVSHRELLWDVEPLQIDGIHVKEPESVVSLLGRRVFTALHEKLLKTKDYLIEMRVGTEKGLSEATSKLFLPARIKGLSYSFLLSELMLFVTVKLAQLYSESTGVKTCMSLHHLPYFVYVSS